MRLIDFMVRRFFNIPQLKVLRLLSFYLTLVSYVGVLGKNTSITRFCVISQVFGTAFEYVSAVPGELVNSVIWSTGYLADPATVS